jgi:hypothetical protein
VLCEVLNAACTTEEDDSISSLQEQEQGRLCYLMLCWGGDHVLCEGLRTACTGEEDYCLTSAQAHARAHHGVRKVR